MGDPGDGRRRGWTLLLLRDDGVRAGRWSFGAAAAAAAAVAVVLLLAGVGVAGTLWWTARAEREQIHELRAELRALRAEREQVRELAARLDSIERDYRRIRRIMGTGAGSAGPAVRLPRAAGSGESREGTDVRAERWRWPLARRGFVTRRFDASGAGAHPGLDVAVPSGSYVRAARPGVVDGAGSDAVYGRFVRLRHDDGSLSLYGHAEWLFVRSGDSVEGGEVIALSGNTGKSSAPHLHFEVRREGRAVDPAQLLRGGTGGPETLDARQGGGSP